MFFCFRPTKDARRRIWLPSVREVLIVAYKPRLSILEVIVVVCMCLFAVINMVPLRSDDCIAMARDNAALKALLHRNVTAGNLGRAFPGVGEDILIAAVNRVLEGHKEAAEASIGKAQNQLRGNKNDVAHNVPDKNGFQCAIPDDGSVLPDIALQPMASLAEMRLVPGANKWGIPMANSTLNIDGVSLTFDQILYGYDLIFENLAIFSRTSWFGIRLQQDPADAFALQGLLWRNQPDLLIEIGTNTGGGAVFYASIMREYNRKSLVLTIDPKDPAEDWAQGIARGCEDCIDARCADVWHTNVKFLLGFSHDVFPQVKEIAKKFKRVMVMHDGSHFYDDVVRDLKMFDEITTVGSYMIVQDTKMTRMYSEAVKNGYPLRAAEDFLNTQGKGRYKVDRRYEYALYSQHHNGWLRKMTA